MYKKMGSDDSAACNTGLSLGLLGFDKTRHQKKLDHLDDKISNSSPKKEKGLVVSLKFDHVLPSLSLGPVDFTISSKFSTAVTPHLPPLPTATTINDNNHSDHLHSYHHQISTNNISPGSSSYSNNNNNTSIASFKRYSNLSDQDKEFGGEDEEDGGDKVVSSRVSDEDEEASPRKKLRLSREQSAVLEDSFKEHSTLNPNQKQALAKQLNLRPRQVEVWFQNRRARTKLKQTEMDCELLKKCCETLTEENKKLRKEIQELKSLKMASSGHPTPSVCIEQMPAATLSMCLSCERFIGANSAVPLSYNSGQNHHHGSSTGGGPTGLAFHGINGSLKHPQLSFITRSSSAAC